MVFAIAPSSVQRGLIWAGTNDGQVWYTRDGGKHWNNVTANISGLLAWGTVRKIQPSTFDAGTAYLAMDFHLMDDRHPYIYKTTDYGRTWANISGDLPAGDPLGYVMAVTENPNRRGMLFAGTGDGFYYSLNDGQHWIHYQNGLPAAEVSWILAPKLWRDVVVSTYGRGIYILHDITWMEQSDHPAPAADAARFYPPRPGYRNAREGHADFLFSLPSAPRGSVTVDILDQHGHLLRTMSGAAHAGFNRVSWDLRLDGPAQVALKTLAPDNPFIWDDPRFKGHDTRPIIHWGIEGPERTGPLAAPGGYVARLTVDSVTYTQPFDVLKDPAVSATTADLVASYDAQRRIVTDIDTAVAIINQLETLRKEVADRRERARRRSVDHGRARLARKPPLRHRTSAPHAVRPRERRQVLRRGLPHLSQPDLALWRDRTRGGRRRRGVGFPPDQRRNGPTGHLRTSIVGGPEPLRVAARSRSPRIQPRYGGQIATDLVGVARRIAPRRDLTDPCPRGDIPAAPS